MKMSEVVSHDEWVAARRQLLAKEKEWNHQRDALSAKRRQMPMEEVTKEYVFEGPQGRRTLADLFEGKRQLLVYHLLKGTNHKLTPTRIYFLKPDVAVIDGEAEIFPVSDPNSEPVPSWMASFTAIFAKDQRGQWVVSHIRSYTFLP